jgi:hypothetical protein
LKEPSSQERRERERGGGEREGKEGGEGLSLGQPVKKEKIEGQSEFWAKQKNFGIGQPSEFFKFMGRLNLI